MAHSATETIMMPPHQASVLASGSGLACPRSRPRMVSVMGVFGLDRILDGVGVLVERITP